MQPIPHFQRPFAFVSNPDFDAVLALPQTFALDAEKTALGQGLARTHLDAIAEKKQSDIGEEMQKKRSNTFSFSADKMNHTPQIPIDNTMKKVG